MQNKDHKEKSDKLYKFVQTVRIQSQRQVNKTLNDDSVTDSMPKLTKLFYTNMQIKLIDLFQSASIFESFLKNS